MVSDATSIKLRNLMTALNVFYCDLQILTNLMLCSARDMPVYRPINISLKKSMASYFSILMRSVAHYFAITFFSDIYYPLRGLYSRNLIFLY